MIDKLKLEEVAEIAKGFGDKYDIRILPKEYIGDILHFEQVDSTRFNGELSAMIMDKSDQTKIKASGKTRLTDIVKKQVSIVEESRMEEIGEIMRIALEEKPDIKLVRRINANVRYGRKVWEKLRSVWEPIIADEEDGDTDKKEETADKSDDGKSRIVVVNAGSSQLVEEVAASTSTAAKAKEDAKAILDSCFSGKLNPGLIDTTCSSKRVAPLPPVPQVTPTSPLVVKHPISATRHEAGPTVATTTIRPSGGLATTDAIVDYVNYSKWCFSKEV